MERKEVIRGAYRMTGGNSFYDGMITCSTATAALLSAVYRNGTRVSAITQRCQHLCKKEGRKGFYLLCALMFFGFSLTNWKLSSCNQS